MIELFAISSGLGLIAWAIASAVIKLRHWWEDEMERWSDWAREWRQFFETFLPLLWGLGVALVAGFIVFLVYVRG